MREFILCLVGASSSAPLDAEAAPRAVGCVGDFVFLSLRRCRLMRDVHLRWRSAFVILPLLRTRICILHTLCPHSSVTYHLLVVFGFWSYGT